MLFNMDDINKMSSFDPNSPHKIKNTKEEFIEAINKADVPFVTSYVSPAIKKCISFPLKEIFEKYGIFYYTNTISYMLAYALFNGIESVDLWGVAQSGIKEHIIERRGVEFWIGVCSGQGMKITINGPSNLLKFEKGIVYGYKKSPIEVAKEFGFYGEEEIIKS